MTDDRVLELMDPVVKSTGFLSKKRCGEKNKSHSLEQDWPCRPRSKPSVSVDTTFDLPDYDSSCGKKI